MEREPTMKARSVLNRMVDVLLAAALLLMGWLAFRATAPPDARPATTPARSETGWDVPPALQATVLAQLPATFETRSTAAREEMPDHFVPPLSDHDLRVRGETRLGGKRMAMVSGQCKPGALAAAPTAPAGPGITPDPPEACWFQAAYDTDLHRFVQLAFGGSWRLRELRQVDCGRGQFQPVTSLAGLAPEVRSSLQGLSDLADHGADFNPGDVIGPDSPPSRRFALAAVADDRALVAVEHGGVGLYREVWAFERRDGHWDGELRWHVGGLQDTVQALVDTACTSPTRSDPGKGP